MVRTRHSEEFKREAVKLALSSNLPRQAVADDLGIGKSTLGKWITEHRQKQHDVEEPPVVSDDVHQELSRLRRENKILREERELLKKATAFFASQK